MDSRDTPLLMDWIITGASRGIGRALAEGLAARARGGERIFALARDGAALDGLAREAGGACEVAPLVVDLARPAAAAAAGERLAAEVRPGATLVHNAGLWPTERALVGGVEAAYAINCLGPLALQAPLLRAGVIARVFAVSAGLIALGRFDPARTPEGLDFSRFRTYCTTKLAGAVTMREVARRHPSIDFAIVHPGVVATDLGGSRGILGAIMSVVKRRFEPADRCAARLLRLLDLPRWELAPGEAPWFFEEQRKPWPGSADRDERAILAAVDGALG